MGPLNSSPIGKKQEIKWIIGKDAEVECIRELGIKEGASVTVMNNCDGSVIIALDSLRRFALGCEAAYRIKVE